jgi:excisionase family DNA binding protein
MTSDRDLTRGKDRLLKTGQVALIFAVSPKTIARWASLGKLPVADTPGKHLRFRESEIRKLLEGGSDGNEGQ